MSVSQHLAGRRWRATWNGIHLDLYVPFESRLGLNLQLRVEVLAEQAETLDRLPTPGARSARGHQDRRSPRSSGLPARPERPAGDPPSADPARNSRADPGRDPRRIARNPTQLVALTRQAVTYLAEGTDIAKNERQTLLRLKQQWSSYFETANPAEHELPPRPSASPSL